MPEWESFQRERLFGNINLHPGDGVLECQEPRGVPTLTPTGGSQAACWIQGCHSLSTYLSSPPAFPGPPAPAPSSHSGSVMLLLFCIRIQVVSSTWRPLPTLGDLRILLIFPDLLTCQLSKSSLTSHITHLSIHRPEHPESWWTFCRAPHAAGVCGEGSSLTPIWDWWVSEGWGLVALDLFLQTFEMVLDWDHSSSPTPSEHVWTA